MNCCAFQAINEAASLGIATVGLVDSNCDPRLLTYPVPGNDDSPSSVRLFGTLVSHAIIAGKQKRVSVLNSLGSSGRAMFITDIVRFSVLAKLLISIS